jgi:hypothetical protein
MHDERFYKEPGDPQACGLSEEMFSDLDDNAIAQASHAPHSRVRTYHDGLSMIEENFRLL